MTNMEEPQPNWGDKTEWQEQQGPAQRPYGGGYQQQPGYAQTPYGAGYQQPGSAQPPYGGYQPPLPGPQPPYAQPPWQGTAPPVIQTYLVPAILVTLFCFLPTGIAAIVFATQVSSKKTVGDFNGAMRASNKARLWTIVSLVVGIVLIAIIMIASLASNSGSTTA